VHERAGCRRHQGQVLLRRVRAHRTQLALGPGADLACRTWDSDFEDFFIVAIGNSAQTATQFWGLLLNWQFTPVGGCQQQIQAGDEVLYAFDAFNKSYFLKLALVGAATARVGDTVSFTVTDGTTGSVIPAATVAAISSGSETSATDRGGFVSIMLLTPGRKTFKAERSDSIRSNAVQIVVS
jgi:hypothetical protein